jgi:hypothetical protein
MNVDHVKRFLGHYNGIGYICYKLHVSSHSAAVAFKLPKAGKSSTFLKASKRPLPEDAAAEREEHSHQDRASLR